jgi:hypothetical protein
VGDPVAEGVLQARLADRAPRADLPRGLGRLAAVGEEQVKIGAAARSQLPPARGAFDARADELEVALMESAREAVSWLDRHAAYTRTGHHSARTGEWRDGGGLVTSVFLHHRRRRTVSVLDVLRHPVLDVLKPDTTPATRHVLD